MSTFMMITVTTAHCDDDDPDEEGSRVWRSLLERNIARSLTCASSLPSNNRNYCQDDNLCQKEYHYLHQEFLTYRTS